METWGHGDMGTWGHGDMGTWGHGDTGTWGMGTWGQGDMELKYWEILISYEKNSSGKRKTEAQAIVLNPSTVSSSCKRKFVVCPLVYEETNRSCQFANVLKRTKTD